MEIKKAKVLSDLVRCREEEREDMLCVVGLEMFPLSWYKYEANGAEIVLYSEDHYFSLFSKEFSRAQT